MILMSYNPCDGNSIEYGDGANYPMCFVWWSQAAEFANTLSVQEGLDECQSCSGYDSIYGYIPWVISTDYSSLYECSGYRLPIEAEWELAIKSGTTGDFWTGQGENLGGDVDQGIEYSCSEAEILDGVSNPLLGEYAWYCGNSSLTGSEEDRTSQPVGQLLPNGFGLYDLQENVEHTNDIYLAPFSSSTIDPFDLVDGNRHVLRGGYFGQHIVYQQSYDRYGGLQGTKRSGFCLVRTAQ